MFCVIYMWQKAQQDTACDYSRTCHNLWMRLMRGCSFSPCQSPALHRLSAWRSRSRATARYTGAQWRGWNTTWPSSRGTMELRSSAIPPEPDAATPASAASLTSWTSLLPTEQVLVRQARCSTTQPVSDNKCGAYTVLWIMREIICSL